MLDGTVCITGPPSKMCSKDFDGGPYATYPALLSLRWENDQQTFHQQQQQQQQQQH